MGQVLHATGGGWRGLLGSAASMQAHAGAESVQIVIAGFAMPGSSSVPARRISRCGRALEALVTGVGKITLTVALPAAKYWQSRHQHTRVAIGSAVTVYRTAPHRHPPRIAMA
jgi:hypothetical protein